MTEFTFESTWFCSVNCGQLLFKTSYLNILFENVCFKIAKLLNMIAKFQLYLRLS